MMINTTFSLLRGEVVFDIPELDIINPHQP